MLCSCGSCATKEAAQTDLEDVAAAAVYPASNLKIDTYNPGEGWTLAWSDEFEGEVLNEADWNRQVVPAGRFNEEWQAYTAGEDNAYIEGGCLVIRALHTGTEHGHDRYTSARLNTAGKQAWQYGKVAARIQLPCGRGLWPAFWMLGANCSENGGDTDWPHCGEIDIMEFYGSRDAAVVEANLHSSGADGAHQHMGAVAYRLESGAFPERFHVFEIEWDDQRMVWKVDGRAYAETGITTADLAEFHQPFFILLNVAVGGKSAGRPDTTTRFPQTMYVDWVRVYQRELPAR
jgi:beta-glucanase (GH16 family)